MIIAAVIIVIVIIVIAIIVIVIIVIAIIVIVIIVIIILVIVLLVMLVIVLKIMCLLILVCVWKSVKFPSWGKEVLITVQGNGKNLCKCQMKSGANSDTPFLVVTAAHLQSIIYLLLLTSNGSLFNWFISNRTITTKSVNDEETVRLLGQLG